MASRVPPKASSASCACSTARAPRQSGEFVPLAYPAVARSAPRISDGTSGLHVRRLPEIQPATLAAWLGTYGAFGGGSLTPRFFNSAKMLVGRSVLQAHALRCDRCHATRWSSVARAGIRFALCQTALILLIRFAAPEAPASVEHRG
jgi:hypothetical protein